MDINLWLENAATAGEPKLSSRANGPVTLQSRQDAVSPLGTRRSRIRPRSPSGSLLGELSPKRPRRYTAGPVRCDRQSSRVTSSISSVVLSASGLAEGRAKDQTSQLRYERRPRRKTRLDRYEPNQESEIQERHDTSRHHGTRKKRRSKRRRKHKAGTNLILGFHAANVPQDRLTVSH